MNQSPLPLTKALSCCLLTLGFSVVFLIYGPVSKIHAGTELPHPTYTWSLGPADGNWNNAANWNPTGIPDDQSERAVFGPSSTTAIATTGAGVHSIEFDSGASSYTITGNFVFNGGGVFNNSGIEQTFSGSFTFQKGATATSLVTFVDSSIGFARTETSGTGCSAGSATYINPTHIGFSTRSTAGEATILDNHNTIRFDKADAGSATLVNSGGTIFGGAGGLIKFRKSGASSSTIINNGGAVFGGHGAQLTFHKSGADSATLIANGGAGPGSGASIIFSSESSGDTARVEVFGNGNLDISRQGIPSISIGSLEGNGLVFLGSNSLGAGTNNLNTTFAGVISDTGGIVNGSGGQFNKSGTGTLTLTNANTYTGGTTIGSGSLFVNNTTGSGTGTGEVQANSGTFGGAGIVGGPVVIGSGAGSGAVLSPGASADVIGVFTLLDTLTFHSDGAFEVQLDSTAVTADQVIVQGATIDFGAQITVSDLSSSTLPAGTSFTIIDNSGATAIVGAFSNLPDGGTLTVGSNTFAADYGGGDGNDLTLTVVP